MTNEHSQHLNGLVKKTEFLMALKYKKGVEEHGGNIWDMTDDELLDNAIDEAIDQVVYLLTLKEKRIGKQYGEA